MWVDMYPKWAAANVLLKCIIWHTRCNNTCLDRRQVQVIIWGGHCSAYEPGWLLKQRGCS